MWGRLPSRQGFHLGTPSEPWCMLTGAHPGMVSMGLGEGSEGSPITLLGLGHLEVDSVLGVTRGWEL